MVKVLMRVLKFPKQHKIYFLKDLSQRVDSVKEENLKLRAENQVLGQYIENLMAASSVFQSTSPRVKKK
jgi:short coiled-coil protein